MIDVQVVTQIIQELAENIIWHNRRKRNVPQTVPDGGGP
jgi:hypothetical protein